VSAATQLPYLDEHETVVLAPPDAVWAALRTYADKSLGFGAGNPLALILGTQPRMGFEATHEVPMRELRMAGRHRFSRYALVFELAQDVGGQTTLKARSYAEFPGLHGRMYRALVVGTRAHVVATRHILGSVRRLVRT
jgi:hypothetical protein